MKVGKLTPLPQFNDQEGTHFGKLCGIQNCGGRYRRYHKNDMPICDKCGHVYRSGISPPDCLRPIRMVYLKRLLKKHRHLRFGLTHTEMIELVDEGYDRLTDPTNLMVLFNPFNLQQSGRRRMAHVSKGQYENMRGTRKTHASDKLDRVLRSCYG